MSTSLDPSSISNVYCHSHSYGITFALADYQTMRTSRGIWANIWHYSHLPTPTDGVIKSWQPQRQIAITRQLADNRLQSLHGYYADLLDAPLHSVKNATRIGPETRPIENLPVPEKEELLSKARIVFGSRLAGPAERRDQIHRASQDIAGVLVPPRPEEPDNCCMSGCVNCVWDLFRDEMEEWAAKSNEARRKIARQRAQSAATGTTNKEKGMPAHTTFGMDDEGEGSESKWEGLGNSLEDEGTDLFADIPVGIREFMKTEKRLKEKQQWKKSISD